MQQGDVVAERFVIERLAGEGGMGAVYRATDRSSGHPVAIKVLQAHGGDAERFEQEARMLAGLAHAAIVQHVAHGLRADGGLYLVMEWLEGEDLAERLLRQPLDINETLACARCVAAGLAVAHAKGIVHRDIKPSNLFLVGNDPSRVKVLDFGVARPIARSRVVTNAGAIVGTIGYMAPEQAIGSQQVDARADLFALGCVLFECFTGQPAFWGEHVVAILAKVLREEPPLVGTIAPNVPPDVEDLVARLLAKDRAERPADGAAVLRELEGLKGSKRSPSIRVPAMTAHEQRIVNVILAELEPAALAATVAPEEMPRTLAETGKLVEPFGGDVAQLANGTFIVTLSAQGSATDAAAQVAACALALREAHPNASIGVATGRVETHGVVPMGPTIDRAAALVRQKGPGIRIDTATAELLGSRFEMNEQAGVTVLAGRREDLAGARTLLGKPTPCVGREKELALLRAAIEECRSESAAQAILLTAPPGTGKSRLVWEIASELEGGLLFGRGDVLAAGAPFAVAGHIIRAAAGITQDDSLAERIAKIRTRVAVNVPAKEQPRVTELLAELSDVRIPDPDASALLRSARSDPALMEDALRSAFATFLASECAAHPVVLVLEDLHWADAPSIKLVGALLRELRDKPFIVLATARPDVGTTFPDLWSESGTQEIRLGTLSKKAGERLARDVLGPTVSAETIASVVERAAGNPYFLEELLRAVAEGGDARVLPDTVLGVMQSRLDALGPDYKRVLRAASILGESFSIGAVEALLGGNVRVRNHLHDLLAKEIFDPGRDGRDLAFRHGLLRDAAYSTLTDVDRKLGHELAGAWLEARGVEERSETVAYHFAQAERFSRAFLHGRKAAARAARLSRFAEARAMIEQARLWLLELPDDRDRRELLFELLLEDERLCDNIGAREDQQARLDQLVAVFDAERDPLHLSIVAVRQAELHQQLGRIDAGFESLAHALDLARSSKDSNAELRALRSLAFLCWQSNRDEEALAYNERCIALGRAMGVSFCHDLVHLAGCLRRLGRMDEALTCLEESMRVAVEGGDPVDEMHTIQLQGALYGELGYIDQQLACYERALEIQNAHGLSVVHKLITLGGMAGGLCRQGQVEKGLELYLQHVQIARDANIRPQLAQVLSIIGELLVGANRHAEALPFLAEAAEVYESIGEPRLQLQTLEGAARAARVVGDDVLVQRHYTVAIRLASQLGESAKEADLVNGLAIHAFERGEYDDALRLYEHVLGIFTALGDRVHRGLVLNSIGATLERLGRIDDAVAVLDRAASVARDANEPLLEGHALALLGKIALARGDRTTARRHYEASLALRRAIGDRRGEGWMLHHLGVIAVRDGDPHARSLLESAASFADADGELSVACRRILEELG